MKLKRVYASVAGALMLGGAAATLANEYYILQPASSGVVMQPASSGFVVQERIVTTPAHPVIVGTPMTMSYTVDDAYPFPSPETRVVQSGVFVPSTPAPSATTIAVPVETRAIEVRPDSRWASRRNPNSD